MNSSRDLSPSASDLQVAKSHTPDRVAVAANAICKSGRFESGQGTCAMICMDQLGDVRKKGCSHVLRVHRKLADAVCDALFKADTPDLLEATKALTKVARSPSYQIGFVTALEAAADAAEAAISKAEGK